MNYQNNNASTRSELLSLFSTYISIIRNIFLITSISFVSFNYSNSFKKLHHRKAIHILSFCLTVLSVLYGYFSTRGLHNLINNLKIDKEDELLYKQIKNQIYLAYLGLFILICLGVVSHNRLYGLYF